jgi:hypothetical protein
MAAVRFSAKHPQAGSEPKPDDASVRAQLERILATEPFQHSRRYPALLQHVVEQTILGAADELKERTLGVAVFRRNPEYDTSADPAGLGERGGAAATEFLTNPDYMDRFAAQAPRGWEHRNLEIVIETELANGDWGEPHVVAAHVW